MVALSVLRLQGLGLCAHCPQVSYICWRVFTCASLVARGNCTFYEKVRLAQGSGARGLLIVSKEALVRPPGLLGSLGPWGRDWVRV